MIDGPTKQMIAIVRKEFQDVLNLIANPGNNPEEFIDDLVERIEKFDEHLRSIDVAIVNELPPLGISVGDHSPSKDVFGPKTSQQGPIKRYTTNSNSTNPEEGQPGLEE